MSPLLVALALGTGEKINLPGSPLGIAWSFLYGANGVPAEKFVPKVRGLGGGFSKVYLFWAQMEPVKGQFEWAPLDAYVKQLKSPDEGLVSLFSVSPWATRRSALALPPSPAKDPKDYYRFVYQMVRHCRGQVRYWENDAEPSNPVYWSGTKEEFVDELKLFYKAVKDADPKAQVVAGGFDGLFNPPNLPEMPNQRAGLAFFDYVLKEGRDAFDIFDLRLYANPYTIVGRVETMRNKMKALGYEKPIISAEYGGPGFFEFAENRKYASMIVQWSQALATTGSGSGAKGVADLYAKMNSLAPHTQMFMQGCSPELQAKFERIQARDLVMRNLLALSAGVQKTLYWDLWNDATDRNDLMTLMYGKIMMFGYEGKTLSKKYPVADVYRRMADKLNGVESVQKIDVPDFPTLQLFEVMRKRKKTLWVAWVQRDTFTGEDSPSLAVSFPISAKKVTGTDVFGTPVGAAIDKGALRVGLSVTPVFFE